MTKIKYKRSFFNVLETYGKHEPEDIKTTSADIIINTQLLPDHQEGPLVKKMKKSSFQMIIPTFIIDLSPEEEQIFQQIDKKARERIRQAINKDKLIYTEYENPTDEQLLNFSILYNSFAEEKKISKCLIDKLTALRDKHSLLLTEISDQENNLLCSHTLLLDKKTDQASGIYFVTQRFSNTNKALISRANRCLHWKEMQSIKKKGYKWYSLGGIVIGKEGEGINKFKKQMGAVRGYDLKVYHSNSIKGILCNYILFYKWKRYFMV